VHSSQQSTALMFAFGCVLCDSGNTTLLFEYFFNFNEIEADKFLNGDIASLIREHISWENDIYSLQSWKGTEYNNCLVLSSEFNCSSFGETNMANIELKT
jgi:hypothetical protein